MIPHLSLGAVVVCVAAPEWGVGQVQSIIGNRVTVTFEEGGKRVFIGEEAADGLELAPAPAPEPRRRSPRE